MQTTSVDGDSVDGHEWAPADDVRDVSFSKLPLGKRGYDEKSVNDFLQLAARRLEGRGQLSADDVRGVRFQKPPIFQRVKAGRGRRTS